MQDSNTQNNLNSIKQNIILKTDLKNCIQEKVSIIRGGRLRSASKDALGRKIIADKSR